MSNPLAIAAVTATVRDLILRRVRADVPGTQVTTRPIDRARVDLTGNQVNLFLFQTTLDGAWRNMDMPRQVLPGESGAPPLPLVLHYLVTAYSDDDAGVLSHRLLGHAMSVLHDHPLLGAPEIVAAANAELKTDLKLQDLSDQLERVRITPMPLSVDELSRLWTTFQTQYRISAAYEVAVVLIDSHAATRTPLPVLSRGEEERGPVAQAGVLPPLPTLEEVLPPDQQPSALPGDLLTLHGHHLGGDGATVMVRFANPRVAAPVDVTPPGASVGDARVEAALPGDRGAGVPAGFWTVRVVHVRTGEPDRITNELPLMVAPRIATPLPLTVNRNPASGEVRLTLACAPPVLPGQRAYLLLGERQLPSAPHPTSTGTLEFVFGTTPEERGGLVRLRVDGVDSLLVDRSGARPVFHQDQRVSIQ